MTRLALAAFVSAYYLAALGVVLIFAPNFILPLVGFAAATDGWIRVVGVLVASFGWYSFAAARNDDVAYYRASLIQRPAVFIAFVALVLGGLAEPTLILFGSIELLGAVWTFWAIMTES